MRVCVSQDLQRIHVVGLTNLNVMEYMYVANSRGGDTFNVGSKQWGKRYS